MKKTRNKRDYTYMELVEIEPQERLFYFLRFEPICEIGDKTLFHSIKELAIYFLERIKKRPTQKAINSTINSLRYKLGLRPISDKRDIQSFREELFIISTRKAQKLCKDGNEFNCRTCPLKYSFHQRFNRRFKAVYPDN